MPQMESSMKRKRLTNLVVKERNRIRLAYEEAQICFDLFAEFVGLLLQKSNKVRALVSSAFPIVILDEFQDTSADQWEIVKLLGFG